MTYFGKWLEGPYKKIQAPWLDLKFKMAGTKILTTYTSNPLLRLTAFLKPTIDGEKTRKGKITSCPYNAHVQTVTPAGRTHGTGKIALCPCFEIPESP